MFDQNCIETEIQIEWYLTVSTYSSFDVKYTNVFVCVNG